MKNKDRKRRDAEFHAIQKIEDAIQGTKVKLDNTLYKTDGDMLREICLKVVKPVNQYGLYGVEVISVVARKLVWSGDVELSYEVKRISFWKMLWNLIKLYWLDEIPGGKK